MEPADTFAAADDRDAVVAKIEQKALRLSALLRVVHNHPIVGAANARSPPDDVLELLGCRVAATRALLHPMPALPEAGAV